MTKLDTTEAPSSSVSAQADDFQTGRVVTISAAHGVHDTYTAFLPSLLPVFINSFLLSNTEAGLLSVFMQVPSLLQPFIGHLADRLSLRYLVIFAPAATAVMMSLLGIAPGYAVLALLLAGAGLSSASLHAVGPVMAGRVSGQNLGRGMGFWMVGGELGRTLGPLIIVSALQILTLQGIPTLMVAGLLVSAVLFILLRNVVGGRAMAAEPLSWQESVRSIGPLVLPFIGIIVVRAFMVSALTTYLPTFLSEEGVGLFFAGASLSILEAAGVMGVLAGGVLSDRVGRRLVLLTSILLTGLLMLALVFVSGWLRLPLLLLLGFFALSIGPVIMALVQESSPDNRALANGVYMGLSFLLRSGVIVLVGVIGDLFDLRTAFFVSAVITLLGLPLVLFLPSTQPDRAEAPH